MEALGLIVAFIGGILADHFVLNKLAGYVSEVEAETKAKIAAIEGALGMHVKETTITVASPEPPKAA